MKKLIAVAFAAAVFLTLRSLAQASEGVAYLRGEKTASQCFAVSILVAENDFRLSLACRDLTVPPAGEVLYYQAWARREKAEAEENKTGLSAFGRGAFIYLGDITGGKLSAKTRESFSDIFLTAEAIIRPKQPDLDRVVVEGAVQPIPYQAGEFEISPSPGFIPRVTVSAAPSPTPVASAGHSVVGAAFRVFFVVLGIIVAAAVAISVLQRRSARR